MIFLPVHKRQKFQGESFFYSVAMYHVSRIIRESNIWRFAPIMLLAGFQIGKFQYFMERNPCYGSIMA